MIFPIARSAKVILDRVATFGKHAVCDCVSVLAGDLLVIFRIE